MSVAPRNTSATPPDSFAGLVPEAAHVYGWFWSLTTLAKQHFFNELGGRLLLYGSLNAEGAAIALAGNIAGLATLGIDADGERLKQGIRHGFCDFLVNNLDEALRILKNEVRKKQPVSVCLEEDFSAILRAMVERGVQPDLLAFEGHAEAAAMLVERGATRLRAAERSGRDLRSRVSWSAASAPALWLPKVDALAASVLSPGDERLRWLKLAPRYLGRSMAGRRYLEMTQEESAQFEASLEERVASGEIGVSVSVERLR